MSYFPVKGRSVAQFGVGAVVVDITARKHLEQMQQDFLDGVSHDLNSPLAALHVRAQLLRRRAAKEHSTDSKWMHEGAVHIEELTTRMVRIADDLADVAHLRTGQALDLKRAKTDLIALVQRAVDEQRASTARHQFTVQATGASLVGDWDATRIERVMANLLGNAVKYSPDGGPVTIEVNEIRQDAKSWAAITIRDQGIGIPAADLPHVFERHRRGANVVGKIAGDGSDWPGLGRSLNSMAEPSP